MHRFKVGMLVGVATALAGSQALAADIARPVYKAPAVAIAAYNWSGWYVGGNLGYGWGANTGGQWDSATDNLPTVSFTGYFAAGGNVLPGTKPKGILGGAQLGFNWQPMPSWVWGLVADIQASDLHDSASASVTPPASPFSIQSNESRIDWFGTVRAKAGYALNNWLIYGTGGLAYGNVKSNLVFNCSGCVPTPTVWSGSTSSVEVGCAAGAGIEVALTQNWIFGVEYLHINLGSISTTAGFASGAAIIAINTNVTAKSEFSADIVRGTLNYRF